MSACRDLRVEYVRAPIGIGVRLPRFSWIADHAQEAYELEVSTGSSVLTAPPAPPVPSVPPAPGHNAGLPPADRDSHAGINDLSSGSPALCSTGRSDLADKVVWTTGAVDSAETSLIAYAGEPLRSNTAYTWRVRSRSTDGDWTPWAESSFGTALLDASDWVAAWVEPEQRDAVVERWSILDWVRGLGPEAPLEERLRQPQLIRQPFVVREELVSARLYATARGVYSAFVNGERADDQVLAPGSDAYEHRISVQCYDVAPALVEGENVLGFALADGWWAGRLGLTGSSAQFGTRLSAIWQLHLEYVDGTTEVVASGADARSATGPWAYADLFVGELYDRRAVQIGWDRAGFDDGDWAPVVEVGRDHSLLRPFTGEPIRRILELPAIEVTEGAEGAIVDFGQVIAGRVRLRLRDTVPGQRIVIEHTETLAADGSWFDNIAGINKEQTDVLVAAGGGPAEGAESIEEWEPEFTFHGFRYARLAGLTAPLEPRDIVAVVIASDLDQIGSFAASDARLTRLHDNVVWSQRANFLSVPTDCPQRERAGWTGDIQAFVGAASNNAQVVPFLSRWLDNLRADQLPDGRIPIFSPRSPFDAEAAATAQGIGSIVAAAGWSDAIAIVPWVLYERYGDRCVLEENYDAMLRWIDFQRATAAAEVPASLVDADLTVEGRLAQALLYNSGDHFGDWLTPSTMEGRPMHEAIGIAPALTSEYIAPMFQAQTLTITARIATVLGRETDAADLAARAREVREAFAAEYVDSEGDLPVRLQGVYVLALAFDVVPPDLRPRTAARLIELIHERGDRLDTGFLSTPYLLDVLCDHGYPEVARSLLWQSEMPSWLYEVDRGATTIWEAWDAITPDGEIRAMSLNHYAPGSVDDWLYRRVAGIRPTSPGYRAAVIEPDFEVGVDSVRAHVGTPYGPLAVEWTRTGDAASITVDVPHGVAAQLATPGGLVSVGPGRSTHSIDLGEAES